MQNICQKKLKIEKSFGEQIGALTKSLFPDLSLSHSINKVLKLDALRSAVYKISLGKKQQIVLQLS